MATTEQGQAEFKDVTLGHQETVVVNGDLLQDYPQDLYIPPYALKVFLDNFEGPLDLLLYLIKKQNFDILTVPIAHITHQYMQYINLMQDLEIELAGEYLLMAAMLAQIKSRMLLPKPSWQDSEQEEDDPRAQLIRQLQAYEQFKQAADYIDNLPQQGRDFVPVQVDLANDWPQLEKPWPVVELQQLQQAMSSILTEKNLQSDYQIQHNTLSVRERMSSILSQLQNQQGFIPLTSCFDFHEGRHGVVVAFIAILELLRHHAIDIVASDCHSHFYLYMHH